MFNLLTGQPIQQFNFNSILFFLMGRMDWNECWRAVAPKGMNEWNGIVLFLPLVGYGRCQRQGLRQREANNNNNSIDWFHSCGAAESTKQLSSFPFFGGVMPAAGGMGLRQRKRTEWKRVGEVEWSRKNWRNKLSLLWLVIGWVMGRPRPHGSAQRSEPKERERRQSKVAQRLQAKLNWNWIEWKEIQWNLIGVACCRKRFTKQLMLRGKSNNTKPNFSSPAKAREKLVCVWLVCSSSSLLL